jgi:hypothetical protein
MVKISSVKNLKPLNETLIGYLHEIMPGLSSFDHVGTIRSKPYIKVPKEGLNYRINTEPMNRLPSLSLILKDVTSIMTASS